jgi:hypothetical protein
MSEGAAPQTVAWIELDDVERERVWSEFDDRFGFRASTMSDRWPAIREPSPSLTFDLSVIAEGPQLASAYDAINAEGLRAFVWALPEVEQWLALDWQHPAYLFRPAALALASEPVWSIPVYPEGDYYSFLIPDMTAGTFGHPWEKTLCVFGEPLINTLGASLATWLPILRRDGLAGRF